MVQTYELFAERIRSLWQETYPGLWHPQLIFVPCRSEVVVPHLHGRVPEIVELSEASIMFRVIELLGNVRNKGVIPVDPPDQPQEPPLIYPPCVPIDWDIPADGAVMTPYGGWMLLPTTGVPDGTNRLEGEPILEAVHADPATVTVKSWSLVPVFALLVTGSRRGVTGPENAETERSFGVFCDFVAGPTTGGHALDVTFYDTSVYSDSVVGVEWDWDWGDTTPHGTGPNPTHTYADAGTYTVTMTVTLRTTHETTAAMTKVDYIVVT